eukprot:CAMPEP_0183577286 /NCGR_PEP_ID=MMETSP0371-20130417/139486_1 /TAXON_ID=268820 /ORGANISM="Peridinium aciculiferum, Strain PAER-2" /LENGTH=263 /DNA_ID=CAMNT_0025787609 /DNA_START=14 /DNA_END=801 /DNA_ORIENTATION=+
MILRRQEAEKSTKEERAAAGANFSPKEVVEFRELFMQWAKENQKKAGLADDGESPEEAGATKKVAASPAAATAARSAARRSSLPLATVQAKKLEPLLKSSPADAKKQAKIKQGLRTLLQGDRSERLPVLFFFKTVGSTGLRMANVQRKDLYDRCIVLIGEEEGGIDFADFLTLMRWIATFTGSDGGGASSAVPEHRSTAEAAAAALARRASAAGARENAWASQRVRPEKAGKAETTEQEEQPKLGARAFTAPATAGALPVRGG